MSTDTESSSFASRFLHSVWRRWNYLLDKTTVYGKTRWLILVLCCTLYVLRVVLWVNGFYIVTYALGIYMLNMLIGFLSPQVDPESEDFSLPVRDAEEYRPFQRKLHEFKFWLSILRAVVIAFILTFFPVFDLPVFWPILLVYFLLLFFLTMRQQVRRMIRFKYLPFSWGKQTYGDITRGTPTPPSSGIPVVRMNCTEGGGAWTHAKGGFSK